MNLLLSHGSPDSRHQKQAEALALRVSEMLGDEVRIATLDDSDAPHGTRVLPLFLGEGRHALKDAEAFADRFDASLLPPLAESAGRLADLGVSMAESIAARNEPVIFIYYRFQHFERLVASVYAQRKRLPKMSMASLHGAPGFADLARFWEKEGVTRLAVQPMLLFAGCSLDSMQAGAGSLVPDIAWGEPLAMHSEMPQLIADCFRGMP